MYNRYNDISKFITDSKKLQIINNNEVYISKEDDYDIAVVLEEGQLEVFEDLRDFIVCIAQHICKIDNCVQEFYRQHSQALDFPFDLEIVYIDEVSTHSITLDYWEIGVNNQFLVECVYENNRFIIQEIGNHKLN